MTAALLSRSHLKQWGTDMADTQTAFFDAREHEQPPAHRLTHLPLFGADVRALCSCGRSFVAATSDLMELAYKRHHAGACSR